MVRALAALFAVVLAVPAAPAGGQDLKSTDLAKQLVQLLDDKKLDAIAAADTGTPGAYAAALYLSGTQLLVVSAKYSAPSLLDDKLAKKDYRDIYVDLTSSAVAGTRVLVMDTFGDGLVAKPKGDSPADSIERDTGSTSFDGEPKKAKLNDAAYAKLFDEAETAYSRMLRLLIAKLKSAS